MLKNNQLRVESEIPFDSETVLRIQEYVVGRKDFTVLKFMRYGRVIGAEMVFDWRNICRLFTILSSHVDFGVGASVETIQLPIDRNMNKVSFMVSKSGLEEPISFTIIVENMITKSRVVTPINRTVEKEEETFSFFLYSYLFEKITGLIE